MRRVFTGQVITYVAQQVGAQPNIVEWLQLTACADSSFYELAHYEREETSKINELSIFAAVPSTCIPVDSRIVVRPDR